MPVALPIDTLKPEFAAALGEGPVVLSAPTGSGKSTRVPVWCSEQGRVLVIEPRRVACRSLASRISEELETELGSEVGYIVRDDKRASESTRIVFVTPGVALRLIQNDRKLSQFRSVILDEFHERGMDTDLILAALQTTNRDGLVVMSATIDVERLAEHLSGTRLEGDGRVHPVTIQYQGGGTLLPTPENLDQRVMKAIETLPKDNGHVLVFLPGKAEITACHRRLTHADTNSVVLKLHGGLSLKEQSRVFKTTTARKIILTTNVE